MGGLLRLQRQRQLQRPLRPLQRLQQQSQSGSTCMLLMGTTGTGALPQGRPAGSCQSLQLAPPGSALWMQMGMSSTRTWPVGS